MWHNLVALYNASPKILGLSLKNLGQTYKIWVDFTQLATLIANISGNSLDIKNRKGRWSRTIPPAFSEVRWTLVHWTVG